MTIFDFVQWKKKTMFKKDDENRWILSVESPKEEVRNIKMVANVLGTNCWWKTASKFKDVIFLGYSNFLYILDFLEPKCFIWIECF